MSDELRRYLEAHQRHAELIEALKWISEAPSDGAQRHVELLAATVAAPVLAAYLRDGNAVGPTAMDSAQRLALAFAREIIRQNREAKP